MGEADPLQGAHGGPGVTGRGPPAARAQQARADDLDGGGGNAAAAGHALGHVPDALPIDCGGAGDGGPEELDAAARDGGSAQQGAQGGGLAGAVRSREGHGLARGYGEVDAVEDQVHVPRDVEVGGADDGCRRGGGTRALGPGRGGVYWQLRAFASASMFSFMTAA